ncbi:MAG TPA: hypothetical protein VGP08_10800 [Pyrinomonadaceae bacterium]|nr:hypothetical protein [Pyrinomonadaceae bacterium]
MRKAVRLTLLAVPLSLAACAARAQPQQPQTGHEERCRAYALEYLGPSPDKIHLTVRQEAEAEYQQARKYLRLCADLDNGDVGRAKDIVAGHEITKSIDRLLAAVRNPDGLEAKDPETYAAVAAAYDVRYKGLIVLLERVPGEQSAKEAAKKEADDLADLLTDLYARAVSACGEDAKCRERKAAWSVRLTEVYKSRHDGSDAGLREHVAGALTKPLPGRWLKWWMANSL